MRLLVLPSRAAPVGKHNAKVEGEMDFMLKK